MGVTGRMGGTGRLGGTEGMGGTGGMEVREVQDVWKVRRYRGTYCVEVGK